MKTDEVLERFSEMMISRMQRIKASDWKIGWFTQSYNGNPVNLEGREYNGMNSFILFFWMMKEGRFKYPIFATFRQIKALGANINKGENGYAREELVAELGAALVSNVLGFSSRILENSAAYLDFWVSKLKQQPKYIVSVLSDANRAAKMVLEVVNSDKCQLSKTA